MQRLLTRTVVFALAAVLAVGVAACGKSKKKSTAGTSAKPASGQKKGGNLKVLSVEGWEHLDPGASYFQLDYEVVYAVHRPLYSFKPDDFQTPQPDLAAAQPQVSPDKKTITIKIRPNIKFSPPVNRLVTSKDVKYAMERGLNKSVANGYFASYFADIVGSGPAMKAADGRAIPGIQTPDDHTIVLKLDSPVGYITTPRALSLPLTAPVPREYAAKFDKTTPSKYDSDPTVQAFTGPYMIKTYSAGKSLTLVRNPNWDPKTDYRPAYADTISWQAGSDPNVGGRQILTRQNLISGDTPTQPIVKQAIQSRKDQISFTAQGNRYVAMNTQIAPFNNVNLRKAVAAILDRRQMQLTRGGAATGDIATHFMGPTAPGFDQAGGQKGSGYDFLANPSGDPAVAAKYMKKAGYPTGKYTGPPILMVGDNSDPAGKTAQVVLADVKKLGFKVNFRSVAHETMYSKFCNVPKQKVQICPNVGWLPDFADGYAWMYVPFDGKAIVPVNNSNWPQWNDPKTNKMIDDANKLDGPARDKAFAAVDKYVTGLVPAVPWFWDKQPNIESKNVQGVIAQWNAAYDLSFSSIK